MKEDSLLLIRVIMPLVAPLGLSYLPSAICVELVVLDVVSVVAAAPHVLRIFLNKWWICRQIM